MWSLTVEVDASCRPGAGQDAGGRGVITWATSHGSFCLGELAGAVRQGVNYVGLYGSNLQASRSLPLLPQESILQVGTLWGVMSHLLFRTLVQWAMYGVSWNERGPGAEQVAWQGLLDESAGGSVIDDTGAGKASIAAAVLTTGRLLLVSATLRPLCTFTPSFSEPLITSFLWLGPALLFCNSAHQVRGQATLDNAMLVATQ